MRHRHLNHEQYTLAAIDDVIDRGVRADWEDLQRAALRDPATMARVRRVCEAHVHDPYAQRYHAWKHYADRHLA
jgi:hypothetical protein